MFRMGGLGHCHDHVLMARIFAMAGDTKDMAAINHGLVEAGCVWRMENVAQ